MFTKTMYSTSPRIPLALGEMAWASGLALISIVLDMTALTNDTQALKRITATQCAPAGHRLCRTVPVKTHPGIKMNTSPLARAISPNAKGILRANRNS